MGQASTERGEHTPGIVERLWGCQRTKTLPDAGDWSILGEAADLIGELVGALDKYADDLCEGWCEKSPDCAHFDDCGGCLARRTAWKAHGGAE